MLSMTAHTSQKESQYCLFTRCLCGFSLTRTLSPRQYLSFLISSRHLRNGCVLRIGKLSEQFEIFQETTHKKTLYFQVNDDHSAFSPEFCCFLGECECVGKPAPGECFILLYFWFMKLGNTSLQYL